LCLCSVDGNQSRSPSYAAMNSRQGEAERLARAPGRVGPSERRAEELAGPVFSMTRQLWLMSVNLAVEPVQLWMALGSWEESAAQEASPPRPEARSASTARPACAGASPSTLWSGEPMTTSVPPAARSSRWWRNLGSTNSLLWAARLSSFAPRASVAPARSALLHVLVLSANAHLPSPD
jgi:hypothetical protein